MRPLPSQKQRRLAWENRYQGPPWKQAWGPGIVLTGPATAAAMMAFTDLAIPDLTNDEAARFYEALGT